MSCIYFPLTEYTVDYKDLFLFLMLGIFFPHEILGTSIIDKSPLFFLWWKANNIIRKIEKEKNTMVMSSFLSTFLFFLFCPNVFSFFHPYKRMPSSIHESILQGVHTLPVHLSDCFFISTINIKTK
jgi:hypothetical protein